MNLKYKDLASLKVNIDRKNVSCKHKVKENWNGHVIRKSRLRNSSYFQEEKGSLYKDHGKNSATTHIYLTEEYKIHSAKTAIIERRNRQAHGYFQRFPS